MKENTALGSWQEIRTHDMDSNGTSVRRMETDAPFNIILFVVVTTIRFRCTLGKYYSSRGEKAAAVIPRGGRKLMKPTKCNFCRARGEFAMLSNDNLRSQMKRRSYLGIFALIGLWNASQRPNDA